MDRHLPIAVVAAVLLTSTSGVADEPLSRERAADRLQPYQGERASGVNTQTLAGKVLAGYQGWFTAKNDGSGLGWKHYQWQGEFRPGKCSIDLWPDVSELEEDERYATPFRHADGSASCVFSSHRRKTVLRHFRWMQQYGIDGVFVQRFAVELARTKLFHHCNTVLGHCREGANRHGRAYALMYDLSGLQQGQTARVIADWKLLRDRMRLGQDPGDTAYLRHEGKPVVGLWGIGFNDDRQYTLQECEKLIQFFKQDPKYGGCTVVLGVPTGWRTLDRDAVRERALHDVILQADVICPWTVGRFASIEQVPRFAQTRWTPDIEWSRKHDKNYLPVVFPGFSWHNMKPDSPLDQIPRKQGRFLWKQFTEVKQAGAEMIYVAMFDEIDEATAIFKCTNRPPTGDSKFLTYEGLPSDHYLWLTGQGGRLLRGEIEEEFPARQ